MHRRISIALESKVSRSKCLMVLHETTFIPEVRLRQYPPNQGPDIPNFHSLHRCDLWLFYCEAQSLTCAVDLACRRAVQRLVQICRPWSVC